MEPGVQFFLLYPEIYNRPSAAIARGLRADIRENPVPNDGPAISPLLPGRGKQPPEGAFAAKGEPVNTPLEKRYSIAAHTILPPGKGI